MKMNNYINRKDLFLEKIWGNVLHVGCADYPIFDKSNNLHIFLTQNYKGEIDGYDINKETILKMREIPELEGKNMFYENPNKKYDFLLVPETIEHVDNIISFLRNLLDFSNNICEMIITAPNAFCDHHYNRNTDRDNEFIEIIHPDHNCWFSPYTLQNVIEKAYSNIPSIKYTLLDVGTVENKLTVYAYFRIEKF